MRLNYRYTIAYSIITLFVLLINFAIVYTAVKRSVTQANIGKLRQLNEVIVKQISENKDFTNDPSRRNVEITFIGLDSLNQHEIIESGRGWSSDIQAELKVVKLTTFPYVQGKQYKIRSHSFIVEADDIYLNGIFMVFAWTFVFLLSLVILSSEVISGYILAPFNNTLQAIQQFHINQKKKITFQETSTYEFQELNSFLLKMTDNAKKDYLILKEFSENASHELQTPIAVIKAKIELLMDSKLDEQQMLKLTSMHDELEKLSRINHSLTLLTKLENYQIQPTDSIDLSIQLNETIHTFADLIEMKAITITTQIVPNVYVRMEEALAQILLNNLISNSIRHNLINGTISIQLTTEKLIIENTGNAPLVPTEELFGRFKKDNQSLNSIGIGLAIVKKIIEIYEYSIDYTFDKGIHCIEISFNTIS
ncbi:sensor histidine kinase [Flavobacterium sp. '19STA2R22 D10 B1']|uniref:sensor histidine kinase n=1 Tax=Flavobacterium aerium TaxID=3037261 RepID=UPI00278C8529|nr:HAMP domain-containing sensor histidine kinase [Flavobacterium sp. '19STA2R22 D10 B1']